MIALIITALALLVLALLLFPVTISFNSVRSGGKIDGSLRVSWIILLLRYALKEKQLEIHIFGRRIFRRISPEKKERIRERKKPGKIPPVRDLLNMTGPLLRLFKDLVRVFRIKYLDIGITFGMKDPACTGILTGFLHAAGLSRAGHNIRWTADFTKPVLDWNLNARVAVTPIKVLPPVARFFTSRQVLRSVREIIRSNI